MAGIQLIMVGEKTASDMEVETIHPQVIQAVNSLSPIVGGHQQPLKRSRELTIPKRSRSQTGQAFDPPKSSVMAYA